MSHLKGKFSKEFQYLKIHIFVILLSTKSPKKLKGLHLEPSGSHVGSILGQLDDFGTPIGSLWGANGDPKIAPKLVPGCF